MNGTAKVLFKWGMGGHSPVVGGCVRVWEQIKQNIEFYSLGICNFLLTIVLSLWVTVVKSSLFAGLLLIHYLVLKTLISKWDHSFLYFVRCVYTHLHYFFIASEIQRQIKQTILLTLWQHLQFFFHFWKGLLWYNYHLPIIICTTCSYTLCPRTWLWHTV